MIDRPMYCEQCRLYPRKCDGADCYYDYLEALAEAHKNDNEQEDKNENCWMAGYCR